LLSSKDKDNKEVANLDAIALLRMFHQGYVVTLAMMITGIVLGKKAQLSAMSAEIPHSAKDRSIEKRMRRFVQHEKIDVEITYVPFAQQILTSLAGKPLLLAMDGSQVGRACMVLMVGVIYRSRLLPIAWVIYKGKKGHTTAERHIEVLKKMLPLVPERSEVILLGDAEYDTAEMLLWVETETFWSFVMHTSPSILVKNDLAWKKIKEFTARKGRLRMIRDVAFTKAIFLIQNGSVA